LFLGCSTRFERYYRSSSGLTKVSSYSATTAADNNTCEWNQKL